MILAILGFIAPFVPFLIKLLQSKMDYTQELRMFELRLKFAKAEHSMKLEEINAQADIAEATLLHKQPASYGIKLLDAAQYLGWSKWSLMIPFYMFVFLDFVSGMVRPGVTYAVVVFYMAYKWARFNLIEQVATSTTWAEQITRVWDQNDFNLLLMVLTYWFGNRIAKRAFGDRK